MMSIEDYRRRAEECELLAETATSPNIRDTMQYVAAHWHALADQDEAKDIRAKPPEVAPLHPSYAVRAVHADERAELATSDETARGWRNLAENYRVLARQLRAQVEQRMIDSETRMTAAALANERQALRNAKVRTRGTAAT